MTLTSITVSPTSATLAAGATQQLTVTGHYSDASSAPLTSTSAFSTSAAAVATVSSTGLVTAVAPGPATITATNSGFTATCAVTATAVVPVVQSIAVTPPTVSVPQGGTSQLTVTATYNVGSPADVTATATYTTSDATKATVTSTGLVTGVAAGGPVTITATFSGKTSTSTVTVVAVSTTGGLVFFGGYDPGVSFVPFGGSTNDVTIDATTMNNGRASLKVVVPGSNYTGGALVASLPRDLRAFNAVTFWAKASVANNLNVAGLGDNAATSPPPFSAEVLGFPITATWTKFVIPLPNPAKLNGSNGLFHFAEGGKNYTLWLNDIQYETLPSSAVGSPTGVTVQWEVPPAPGLGTGSTFQIPYQPNTVSFAVPSLPTGGSLKNVSFRWYDLVSSAPAVATVSATGLVSGLTAGTTSISATMNGLTVAGSAAITVTVPLALPTTIAATPTVAAANVISLFSSAYTNIAVDTWRTGWSAGNNELVDPYVISGHDVKKYTLHNFVGIEFGLAGTNVPVDATTMTTFHVDVWSPNPPTNIEVQLVNDAAGTAAVGKYQSGVLASGSWVSLEIPLSSFTGLTAKNKINQLLFVASGPTVIYVDNIYFHK